MAGSFFPLHKSEQDVSLGPGIVKGVYRRPDDGGHPAARAGIPPGLETVGERKNKIRSFGRFIHEIVKNDPEIGLFE